MGVIAVSGQSRQQVREYPQPAGRDTRLPYSSNVAMISRQRHFFRRYALDVILGDLKHPTKAKLERAIDGHIPATAELMGTYKKGDA